MSTTIKLNNKNRNAVRKAKRTTRCARRGIRGGTDVAIRRAVKYNYSTSTQRFGMGFKALNITRTGEIDTAQGEFSYLLLNDFTELTEFTDSIDNYKYYRVLALGVTIYPNDTMENVPCYINVEWGTGQVSSTTIKDSDQTKIVFNDQKSLKTYIFRPPNAQVRTSQGWVNPTQFMYYDSLTSINIPGTVSFFQEMLNNDTAINTIRYRLDLRVAFKTNKVSNGNRSRIVFTQVKVEKQKKREEEDDEDDSGEEDFLDEDIEEKLKDDDKLKIKEPIKEDVKINNNNNPQDKSNVNAMA